MHFFSFSGRLLNKKNSWKVLHGDFFTQDIFRTEGKWGFICLLLLLLLLQLSVDFEEECFDEERNNEQGFFFLILSYQNRYTRI